MDRCEECGLWNIDTTGVCPECGAVMDLNIVGVCLSWKCRSCDYGVAATVNKLCFWDKKNPSDRYAKKDICPYAEKNL